MGEKLFSAVLSIGLATVVLTGCSTQPSKTEQITQDCGQSSILLKEVSPLITKVFNDHSLLPTLSPEIDAIFSKLKALNPPDATVKTAISKVVQSEEDALRLLKQLQTASASEKPAIGEKLQAIAKNIVPDSEALIKTCSDAIVKSGLEGVKK